MAKAVAKSKKTVAKAAVKSAAKSKPSARPKAVAAAPSARKALKKAAAKPVAKVAAKKAAVPKPAVEAVKSGKWVYTFGDGKAEGKAGLRDLLGGKGANLAEMANLGLPVPPGFTIPTSVCTYFYAHGKTYPGALKAQVEKALDHVGKLTGKSFGDSKNPLLVSVRSGGRASMPGMMDTVLNLGLNDKTVEALAELSGDRRFAYDSYRRFITMYSDVVLGFEHHHFEDILDTFKDSQGYTLDTDLTGDDWVELVGKYKEVVAGIRTPQDITEEARQESGSDKPSMESAMPEAFKELTRFYTLLEKHYRDMQDMEFTVEQGKLWMLQTRGGKRTAKAALRIAVELANEGLISKKDAVSRIDPASLDQLLHPTIDPSAKRDVIATGLPASPGAAAGEIVFSSDEAAKLQADGRKVILVRIETSPEDIHGMHAAEGILTTRGGMTSHAAVVARGMGKPCVSGCGTIRVDYGRGTMSIGSRTFKTGDVITIDGSVGQVLAGRMPMIEPKMLGEFGTLMGWADQVRKLGIRVNADTPEDARTAIKFGGEGIGLCRTEHMLFEETRIRTVREMILAEDEQARRAALSKLLPMQRADFVELFEIMKGLPATIRLLDPPLHEFLPHTQHEIEEVARAMNTDPRKLADRARDLAEFNPMLGFRGCRLAIAYPEIAEMQARAIFEAAASSLGTYVAKGILEIDPFISVDRDGVGELVKIGVTRGRKTRPNLKVGICGEHGGDPASVAFCHEIGLDYVSCSPYRVPIARLAAAQAALGKTIASQA